MKLWSLDSARSGISVIPLKRRKSEMEGEKMKLSLSEIEQWNRDAGGGKGSRNGYIIEKLCWNLFVMIRWYTIMVWLCHKRRWKIVAWNSAM
jgi:hypothetical protein